MSDLSPITGDVATDLLVQARHAAGAGLFRVTGLPVWEFADYDRQPLLVVETASMSTHKDFDPRSVWGYYCSNNSRVVAVSREGEIYWGRSHCSKSVLNARADFFGQYGITSGFVWVPASNGEEFLMDHLIQRLADPFAEPLKGYTPHF